MSKKRGDKRHNSKLLMVLVDMDGVLCKFEERFLELYKEKYPGEPFIPLEEREGFWINDQYNRFGGVVADRVWEIIEGRNFYRYLEPIENGINAVKEIAALDNTVVYLCSSPLTTQPHSAMEKLEWIQEHMGQAWVGRVILATDKTMINGHLLFDDKPYISGVNREPSWDHILYTAWGNKHMDEKRLCCTNRLSSWTDRDAWMKIIEDKRKEIS